MEKKMTHAWVDLSHLLVPDLALSYSFGDVASCVGEGPSLPRTTLGVPWTPSDLECILWVDEERRRNFGKSVTELTFYGERPCVGHSGVTDCNPVSRIAHCSWKRITGVPPFILKGARSVIHALYPCNRLTPLYNWCSPQYPCAILCHELYPVFLQKDNRCTSIYP